MTDTAVNTYHQQSMTFESIQGFSSAAVAMGWQLDFTPIDRGESAATLDIASGKNSLLMQTAFDGRVYQRGDAPRQAITFGMIDMPERSIHWKGFKVNNDDLLVFGEGKEFESVSPEAFKCYTLSFNEPHLQSIANSMKLDLPSNILSNGSPIKLTPENRRSIRKTIAATLQPASPNPLSLLEDELPFQLILGLQSSTTNSDRSSILDREICRKRAEDYIHQHMDEHIPVTRLVEVAGTSWKTLVRAFQEYYGLSPKQFMRSLKLHRVYADLSAAQPEQKVNAIANRWGYWHMGDFAKDFRRQYGCLPSDVLYKK